MIARLLFTLAVLVAGTSQAQTTQLREVSSVLDAQQWQAVGRLDVAGRSFCSATLIAPDLVLTAAHCVYDLSTGAAHTPDMMTFQAGLRDGQAAATARVARIAAHPGFHPTRSMSAENVAHDAALLQLSAPIQVYQLNPFQVSQDAVRLGDVSIVSYGRGRADSASRQRTCQMTDRQAGLFVFDCDVTYGSSGAPVFSHASGRARVVSVISGMSVAENRKVALGMDVQALLPELKAMLRRTATAAPTPKPRIKRLGVGGGKSGTGAKFVRP